MIADDGLNPDERERLAKSRYHTLVLVQVTGVLLMVIGMWVWFGDIVREGGWIALGAPIFAIGVFQALVLPKLLARRWKSPPEQ